SEQQMPEIYNLLPPICEKLGIEVPELYYVRSKEMNAATGGSVHPYIFVTSELVDKVPANLIASVLAHECGHIASKHYLYHSIARQIIQEIDNSPLGYIPGVNRILTPSMVKAFLFWERCSELSADRAAVLCDEGAEHTIDMLLRIHGYDAEKVNRDEFLKQAMDLHDFVNEENTNKVIEEMLVQGDSHPRLATRVYESYAWSQTDQFKGILDGTYKKIEEVAEPENMETAEVISAEVNVKEAPSITVTEADIRDELDRVNKELDRYTNHADKGEYAIAVGVGIVAGIIDSIYVGETVIIDGDLALSHKQVNHFIQEYADLRGIGKDRLKDAISELEQTFKVAQDNVWKGAGIGVSAKNHHLADLAHHPTPLGLLSAIIVQFLRVGTFVNRDGKWHFKFVETSKEDILKIAIPAVLTGILNWLVYVNEKDYTEETGKEVPKAIHRIAHIAASTPLLIEIAKCADNWFGHLVSDMGGSKNTAGAGMGIPGVFISLLYEIASLPVLKDTNLPYIVDDLYEHQKLDMRHELAALHAAKKQAIPVLFVELYTRVLYFSAELGKETARVEMEGGSLKDINWRRVIPFGNRSVDRMLTIASMTFNVADTADAAVHAAIESQGNWILFSGRFVARYNYVGAGRAVYAIVKEISSEKKEAELIHQKLILTEIQTRAMVERLEEYKAWLEERVTTFLAEDIAEFMNGFEDIQKGMETKDSNLIIHGNVTIQKVLGRKPQFTNQEEFDDLMESDEAFVL
ncbi:MAG: M48 family metallopeptidase, partial [Eubacteriales bacterium]|nr:M48 family metallopeptidase [Eubacteriales bacterium]